MKFENSAAFAAKMDKLDLLKEYRKLFYIPKHQNKDSIYFTGNSLGLQPKNTQKHIQQELNDWKKLGVEGHFHAKYPWFHYHHFLTPSLCKLTGAQKNEVVSMNQLTVNLNLLLISFYKPSGQKKKILLEANAFPSDIYACKSHLKLHGNHENEDLVFLPLQNNEHTHKTSDIISYLKKNAHTISLFLLGAVNYYSGQLFEIKKIAAACKELNITFGLDLAHAIGNVPLKLHEWNVDFATWCSYKYLNSGPGGVSGIFVHNRYKNDTNLKKLQGWWGNEEQSRFKMSPEFVAAEGAAGWQMSNAPVLSMAAHKASLEIFDKAGIHQLRKKSLLLSGFMRFLIEDEMKKLQQKPFELITPESEAERGSQISIRTFGNGKTIFKKLSSKGIIADWREPDVIRVAPVPLYNSFKDVFTFTQVLFSSL